MAYGFSVLNNNAQVLISNQTKTMHFVGKANYTQLLGSLDQCGGMRCWQFTINCSSTPLPFLTMPTNDFYAVVGVRNVGATTWVIDVLRSGTSATMPEVYVFTDPNGITYSGSETHGMRVYCDDGSISFDSRLAPLVVTGGGSVAPPISPVNPDWYIRYTWISVNGMDMANYTWWENQGVYSAAVSDYMNAPNHMALFQVNVGGWIQDRPWADRATGDPSAFLTPTNFSTYPISSGIGNTKPIYFFPSFAQATRITTTDYWANSGKYWCMSNYWALYRGGITRAGDNIRCGWIPYVTGAYWKALRVDSGITVGSGVDASSIVGAGAGGMPPYYNETLNLAGTPVIIANGARYD